jgi:hypothetical protein
VGYLSLQVTPYSSPDATVGLRSSEGVAQVTNSAEHDADHVVVRAILEDWDFDPEQQVDILRDTLILHLGAFHGWTVAAQGGVLGLLPMLVRHDRDHRTSDVLEVEQFLDPALVEAMRQAENEIP